MFLATPTKKQNRPKFNKTHCKTALRVGPYCGLLHNAHYWTIIRKQKDNQYLVECDSLKDGEPTLRETWSHSQCETSQHRFFDALDEMNLKGQRVCMTVNLDGERRMFQGERSVVLQTHLPLSSILIRPRINHWLWCSDMQKHSENLMRYCFPYLALRKTRLTP